MKQEIWKDVVGYEGLYQVSNLGRVKSIARYVFYNRHHGKTKQLRKEKMLSQVIMKNGYLRVEMSNNGIHKLNLVHRLVAMAFIPNINNLKEINHINGIKSDNSVENLEWVSSSQNKMHAFENNLYHFQKPILQIKNGIVINEYKSTKECERQTGYSCQNIGKVALGKRKTAYGYQWRYK